MQWYEILLAVIGGIGGSTGLISIYRAKSEKTSVDIKNMQEMLDEARKMYDTSREAEKEIKEEFKSYAIDTKERFNHIEKRLDSTETEVFRLRGAIYQAYRCKFPPKSLDCPVIQQYEKGSQCEECLAIHQDTKE